MEIRKDWIAKWASYAPIKVAVSDAETNNSLTYQQLNDQANQLARHLETFGIEKGDRVGVLSEYNLEYIVLLGAAMKLGFIIVPLNYRLSARELAFMINNCTPSLLIYDQKFLHLVDDKLLNSPIEHLLSMQNLSRELAGEEKEETPFEARAIEDDHPLFIIYTSGTTGFPKGAIYTYRMAFWNAVNTQIRLDITSADYTLICMPPFHTAGWNVLMLPFLLQGGSFSLLKKFEASQVLEILDNEEATLFMGVPTMLSMMADTPLFTEAGLEHLRYIIVGGESMPIPLIETWEAKDIPIRQGFGLTEVGPNIFSLHHDDAMRKIGSIGTPNFFVETQLVKADGTIATDNEEGELWLKGPVATTGYWANPEATAAAFNDGWFKTGDILVRDEEGYYYVKDRIKNMFISGGENVYPAEIEKLLQTHPSIMEVGVVGVPHEKWGEVGKAIVVAEGNLSDVDVLEFCDGKLARFKIPKHITFIDSLPKTDSGKIDRKRLKELAKEK